ncbi:MAG: phosphatase PAP2 family protein [Bacteroidota bacterium]|nr:phosphatase PAP2 family protein [Bacteroidota bacterium]
MKKSPIIALFAFCISGSMYAQENDQLKSPYKNSWSVDGPIFGISIIVAFTASVVDEGTTNLTITEINSLSKNTINPIDRLSAGLYSKDQSRVSDILVGTSIVSPLLLMFDNNIRHDAGTITTMYLETILFATFTPSYGKGGVQRIRPFVYGTKAPLSEKQNNEARRSFFSGHATWAFATSVFFANVYSDYYPNSKYKAYVWYGSIGLASTVSILRVSSGAHFVSDIIVGAAVGSSIGYVIPYLHRNHSDYFSLLPQISPQFRGFKLSLRLK